MRNLRSTALAALPLVLACSARHSADFRADRLRPGDGVASGRIHVALNGQDVTDKCQVCFETLRNTPCVQLRTDGLVVIGLDAGPTWIYRLACAAQGGHQYRFPDAKFTVPEAGRVYFGDVAIDWKHGAADSQVFRKETASDGVATMTVTADAESVTAAYHSIVKDDTLPLTKMLIEPEEPSGG